MAATVKMVCFQIIQNVLCVKDTQVDHLIIKKQIYIVSISMLKE